MIKAGKRLSLQISISILFIVLAVLLGTLLSIQNYNKSSQMLLASADRVYNTLTERLELDIKSTYRPLISVIEMLSTSRITTIHDQAARDGYQKILATILENNPAAANIQIAYPDGIYYIFRSLSSDLLIAAFSAPDGSRFMADYISARDDAGPSLSRRFYDAEHRLIASPADQPSDYDPRKRSWYIEADQKVSTTSPYVFFFSKQIGITAKKLTDVPGVVIAIDITMDRLTETISNYQITPSTEAVLVNANGQVYAYRDELGGQARKDRVELATLDQLDSKVLKHLMLQTEIKEQNLAFDFEGQSWKGISHIVGAPGGVDLFAVVVSPVDELLSDAAALRNESVFTTVLITLFFIPLIWLIARQISIPLKRLSTVAASIARFDFNHAIEEKSRIKEVDELLGAMQFMQSTINRFLGLVESLSGEKKLDALLESVTRETMLIGKADAAVIYLVSDTEETLEAGILCLDKQEKQVGSVGNISLSVDNELTRSAKTIETAIFGIDRDSHEALRSLLNAVGYSEITAISLPLTNRNEELIGLLCLLYDKQEDAAVESHGANLSFVKALSGFAAVTLESRQLLKMQEALLDSFIKLIADAIDAKSPYTGGHCKRVPEITLMLARAACESKEAPFNDFDMTDEQWEELEIASWLHDCGKVTTPEYVVDKATKLETIYDRIHEVRMRFEVLKRDAEIDFWRKLSKGEDREALQTELDTSLKNLDDDFAFIAQCNLGGEYMADDKIQRLNDIAARTWKRTLDDRLGVSWEENNRMSKSEQHALPAMENLLADKIEHIIERDPHDRIPEDNPWGFKLDVPEHKYNRGELYNLAVSRGTLSNEERYKINEHMTQTIRMLEKLPFPKHLRDVPAIAGGHHETMDGKGYPKRLKKEDMSLTARMMAIADIFEALTASDRPYKKAKKLSEAIKIMSFMRNDSHIDADLFKLFLTSGVFRQYADQYLEPEHIDNVVITDYFQTN